MPSTRTQWPTNTEPALALPPPERSWAYSALAVAAATLVLAGGGQTLGIGHDPRVTVALGVLGIVLVIGTG